MINHTNILIPRRTPEERIKNRNVVIQKQIQQYIKNGSKSTLDLYKLPITTLPNNLKNVGGDLLVFESPITALPDGLTIGRDLDARDSKLTSLPNGLVIGRNLDVSYTKITFLPADLKVDNSISIQYSNVEFLPDNLKVKGSLNIRGTRISVLPPGLYVQGHLSLADTTITSIPGDAYINEIYHHHQVIKRANFAEYVYLRDNEPNLLASFLATQRPPRTHFNTYNY
jgi:hypothetical protein